MKKTIGILGGMGPYATVNLFEYIVSNTKASTDNDHIRIIIDNNTNIPDRTSSIMNNSLEPVEELIKSAKLLEKAEADFIIMPCNTAHFFIEHICEDLNIEILNMIELSANYVKQNLRASKIGLLSTKGTYFSNLYRKYFTPHGIEVIYPTMTDIDKLNSIIYGIKKDLNAFDHTSLDYYVDYFGELGVKHILLGCTELSLINNKFKLRHNFIDALRILSSTAILKAGYELKNPEA